MTGVQTCALPISLAEVARELSARLTRLFLPDAGGHRPCHDGDVRYASDPHWRDLVLYHEYFHGDTGRGVGASHQTGWTTLVVRCLESIASARRPRAVRHTGMYGNTPLELGGAPP